MISLWGVLARFNARALFSARRLKRVFAGQRDFSSYLTPFVRTVLTIFATRVSDRMKYNLVDHKWHKFDVSLIGRLKKVIDVVLCRFRDSGSHLPDHTSNIRLVNNFACSERSRSMFDHSRYFCLPLSNGLHYMLYARDSPRSFAPLTW